VVPFSSAAVGNFHSALDTEDFADRWKSKPELETQFWLWYEAAIRDFDAIVSEMTASRLQRSMLDCPR